MFHRSEKAVRYAKELDDARLNGHFHLVPNLARKLQKHDHQKQCVGKSAVCEKTLNDMAAPLEKTQRNQALKKDGPDQLVLAPTIRPENMKEIINSVNDALNSPGTVEEKELANVIAAQMWLTMGQWQNAIEKTISFTTGDSKVHTEGYAYVLFLKAFTYHGMANEGLGNFEAALETYLRGSDYIHASQPATSSFSVNYWIGKILYRGCMLSLRLQEPIEAIENFRRYKRYVDTSFRTNFGVSERLAVYYWYWRTLSEIVRRQIQQKPVDGDETSVNGDASTVESRMTFFESKNELLAIQSQYESVLVDTTHFPRAGNTNQRTLEFVERAVDNWRLLGSDPTDAKVLALYRATTKTFQSPSVMRHLVFALEGSGNYVEAERALNEYLFIVENEKKTLSKTRPEHKDLEDEGLVLDIDSDETILRTMVAGIRFLVKYLNKGKRAFELALKLDSNAKTWKIENPEVLALVWHAIGTANALWSMQSIPSPSPSNKAIEANTRPTIQSAAITAYTTALSYAPNKLETYYQLALQYARQRQLEKSISALSQALRLNKSHIPSIHLLTLVLTALEDYEKALQTCHTVKFDHIDALNLDDAVALMEMQLTYLRIVEVVSGRELALEAQKGVFKLYSRIFGPVHNGTIKQESNLEQKATTTEQMLRRTRSNIHPEKHGLDPNFASGGRDSLESKLSLQVPARLGRPRSVLRKQRRSRSVDGGSMDSHSSGDFSEKPTNSTIKMSQTSVNDVPESTLSLPNHGVGDTKLAGIMPNHGSEMPSKFISSPSERRDSIAKEYRAKLWLACAAIYRRGRQWDGAQAAIQDALLCDVCPEDIFTELGNLHLDKGSHVEAMTNFERALLSSPDYPPAIIGLARTLLTVPNDEDQASSRDRAEVLLDSVTKLAGWDSSEAWFWLGEVYDRCFMPAKAAECWTYCEELEERRPVREWRCVRPEWI